MTDIALPPHVQRRIDLERRAEYWALLKRNFTIEDPLCQEWTKKLHQRVSRDIFIVRANDRVEPAAPLHPGRYHRLLILRDAPPMIEPLMNGDQFTEPGDWMFDVLNRGNLRERRVRDALERHARLEQESIEKERETAKQNRMEKVKDIVNSATRASISMNDSVPWTQNAQGRRPK